MATQAGAHGFWRGFVTGFYLAVATLLALAWFFPPQPLLPPEVDSGSLQAPGAPGLPADATEFAAPHAEGPLPAPLTVPVIAGVPAPDAAPDVPDGAAGAPSLVPRATE